MLFQVETSCFSFYKILSSTIIKITRSDLTISVSFVISVPLSCLLSKPATQVFSMSPYMEVQVLIYNRSGHQLLNCCFCNVFFEIGWCTEHRLPGEGVLIFCVFSLCFSLYYHIFYFLFWTLICIEGRVSCLFIDGLS